MDFRHLAPLMDRVPYRHERELRRLLGRGGWLLDLGGGTGRIARRLRADWARVVVADMERNMLKRARARGLDVVVADATRLPFRPGAFQGTVMVDAFHHFPHQAQVAREVARTLSREGRAVVEEFDPAHWQGRLVEWVEGLVRFGSTFHRPESLVDLLQAAGFRTRVHRFSKRDYAVTAES